MSGPLTVFWQLMQKDLIQFKHEYKDRLINTFMLFLTNVLVFSYFVPTMGTGMDYGAFIMIGAIASFGLFDIIGQVSALIADIEGDRAITFTLSFPMPSWMVFAQMGMRWATQSFLLVLILFPIGKLFLMNKFDLSAVHYGKLLLIFITANLFFGSFALWLGSMLKKMGDITHLFLRFINPLFMFGAYFYPWRDALKLSPIIGYATLINPMVYVMEGMRGAALGQKGYLPFWLCFGVLWVFILACGAHATRRLKRRLDCV
ncbi:MAG: hypothetical protein K940chlam2_01329 [Chlamydiae bacterium]|nr:hypothetical protein [Chlamydiota bacterium]